MTGKQIFWSCAFILGTLTGCVSEDAYKPEAGPLGILIGTDMDHDKFKTDDQYTLRALGAGYGEHYGEEAKAHRDAVVYAQMSLWNRLYPEISREELKYRWGNVARIRGEKLMARLKEKSCVVASETRMNDRTGSITVYVGIEFLRKSLEEDKVAAVVEREPESGDCDVREFGERDFPAKIEGLRSFYRDAEKDTITVTPEQDAYLTVFWVNAGGGCADVTFPCGGGVSEFLPGGVAFSLPEVTFRVDDPTAREEACRIIFVLTREPQKFDRPDGKGFFEALPLKTVSEWIAALPQDARFVHVQPITIRREW